MIRILLVEDNETITMGLEYLLKQEKFECIIARTKLEAENLLNNKSFELILLDISLPDGNGFSLCKQIKKVTDIPVIFLTARDEEHDVVLGFDLGADDYIIKPFRNKELVSRIKNVLRRTTHDTVLTYKDVRIDSEAGKAFKDDNEIHLTKLEYRILFILMSNPHKLFTRDDILSCIWDASGNFVNDNTLTVTIKRLRSKVGDEEGRMIETVRGMGYRLGDE